MEMSLQVEGCEELAFNLRGLAADVRDKFTIQALKAGGAVVRDYSQAEAPVGETGQLATSIVVSVKGGADGVGVATTLAVVRSFLLIILFDCLFTFVFYFLVNV